MEKSLFKLLEQENWIIRDINVKESALKDIPKKEEYDFIRERVSKEIKKSKEELLAVRKEIKEYISFIEKL